MHRVRFGRTKFKGFEFYLLKNLFHGISMNCWVFLEVKFNLQGAYLWIYALLLMSMLIVSSLHIYPIKSLGGISLQTAAVLKKGMAFDRRWMLVDDEHRFLTQRVHPRLALFKLQQSDEGFVIHHDSASLNLATGELGENIKAVIWDDEVRVREVSQAHSDWFSKQLGFRCRLVFFPEKNERPVQSADYPVSLADAHPLLIIGESSLDDLNSKMKSPLPMNRFRPNIVFTGAEAFAEDNWENIRIGEVSLKAAGLCARCVLTTVDQDTGTKGVEPLATLSLYRKWDKGVYFGQNLSVIKEGTISVGDLIRLENE
jgi:uncharacterized protein YcbX